MYKIVLADGTVLDNLRLNGNNFISSELIPYETFENNLSEVRIIGGNTEEALNDCVLVSLRAINNESRFIISEKTEQQKQAEKLEKIISENNADVTEIQLALTEIYEMLIGGM